MLLDRLGQGKAIHFRHHGIEEHQGEGLSGIPGPLQGSQRRPPALHGCRLHAPVGEHLFEDVPVRGVVVHHQHGQISQVRGLQGNLRRSGPALPAEAGGEMKRAALPGFALHPDPAVHHPDQLRRNRQTQPRAPVLARRRAIGLRKRLEDQWLLLGRDPDACV